MPDTGADSSRECEPAGSAPHPPTPALRFAGSDDLAAVNRVVEAAVMTWDLPERVKRLALPLYRYHAHDLAAMDVLVAEDAQAGIIGVAAWEPAQSADLPGQSTALLLHGLYVLPAHQHSGVGARLLHAAELAACGGGFDGLLVKAQRSAAGFFAAQGLEELPVENPGRDYAVRFWKSLRASQVGAS